MIYWMFAHYVCMLEHSEYPRTVPYVMMRSLSGISGALLVPCVYQGKDVHAVMLCLSS